MFWILCCLIVFQIVLCLHENCHWTHTDELACSGIKTEDLSENIVTPPEKESVVLLNVTNSDITKISEDSLKEFGALIELHITESQLDVIENDTFKNNPNLITLNLSNNYLDTFNSAAFAVKNKLDSIDISRNLLKNLSDFNITHFPKLKVLILDDNGLTYLPKEIIDKLIANNDFYLSAEKNPWDCNNPKWKDFLDSKLIDAFCGRERWMFVPKTKPSQRDKRMNHSKSDTMENIGDKQIPNKSGKTKNDSHDRNFVKIQNKTATDNTDQTYKSQNDNSDNKNISTTAQDNFDTEYIGRKSQGNETSNSDTNSCFHCSFYYCIFWFVGGIWLGIIVGNIFKLKKLLCSKPKKTYNETGVQCDPAFYMEQRRMSDPYSGKLNQIKQLSKVSLIKESSPTPSVASIPLLNLKN